MSDSRWRRSRSRRSSPPKCRACIPPESTGAVPPDARRGRVRGGVTFALADRPKTGPYAVLPHRPGSHLRSAHRLPGARGSDAAPCAGDPAAAPRAAGARVPQAGSTESRAVVRSAAQGRAAGPIAPAHQLLVAANRRSRARRGVRRPSPSARKPSRRRRCRRNECVRAAFCSNGSHAPQQPHRRTTNPCHTHSRVPSG